MRIIARNAHGNKLWFYTTIAAGLCLLAVAYHIHGLQDGVDSRFSDFLFVQGEVTNTGWSSSDGGKLAIDPTKTKAELLSTGQSLSQLNTIIRITNPKYTRDLADNDFGLYIAGYKWTAAMKEHGYRAIIFSNGKKSWLYPPEKWDVD